MKKSIDMQTGFKLTVLASALALAMGPASAAEVYLAAKTFSKDLPLGGGTQNVPMWGYVEDVDGTCFKTAVETERAACVAVLPTPSLPGPRLTVPPGDTTLTIHLSNGLVAPTSIIIPGQALPTALSGRTGPTWSDDTTGPRGTNPSKKVRSYGVETAAGGKESYTFTIDRPGTFIYHSGTSPQLQVYMGLYGAITKDAVVGEAYDGVPYDSEVVLFYSDVDPVHNIAVDALDSTYTPIHYSAKWFLVNGEPYVGGVGGTDDIEINGSSTLVRLLSAASETHVPTLQGRYMKIHAEDGLRYNWQNGDTLAAFAPREQYSAMLPPLKTKDAIIEHDQVVRYAVYDGNGYMTNPSVPGNPAQTDELGGMLRFLDVTSLVPPNQAPVLASIGPQTVIAGQLLSFTPTASDPDAGDTLTFSLDPGAPLGSSLVAGVFNWTPTDAQAPGTYSATIRVTDNGASPLDDFETISITVNEVNVAPVLTAIGNLTVDEGTAATFTAIASDANLPGDILTFSLDAGAPAGASIDPTTGAFSWTPGESQGPGGHQLTVRVTDNGTPPLDASETISITVNEVNEAPVLAAIGNRSVNETELLTFTATATDPDIPANTLTFSLGAGAPAGADITPAGVFTWTPTVDQGPQRHSVTVQVDDGTGMVDSETIEVAVYQPIVGPVELYLSLGGNGTLVDRGPNLTNLTYADEDILSWNGTNYDMVFDGSAAGIGQDLFAFHIDEVNDRILMAFNGPQVVPGVGQVDDSDVVAYDRTAGTFSMFFDGSDVELSTNGERLDAISLQGNTLLLSTRGGYNVGGGVFGADEDLIAFTPSSTGANTAGTWALYFDGSDVGLGGGGGEDVNAAAVSATGDIYLSTAGAFVAGGGAISGQDEDVFVCTPSSLGGTTACTFTPFFDGTVHGLSGGNATEVDAIDLP